MSLFLEQEDKVEYGAAINVTVATGIEKMVMKLPSKEACESLKSKLKVPENGKLMGVPKVNPEIWNSLPNKARITDFRLQQMQQSASNGLVSLAKIADTISKSQISSNGAVFTEILQHVKDGVTLIGAEHQQITSRRRMEIKAHIHPEYASICTAQTPASEFLFGDNLEELLKKSKATSDLMRKVTPRIVGNSYGSRPHTVKPYSRGGGSTSLNFSRPPVDQTRRGGQYRGQFRSSWRGQKRGQKPGYNQYNN